ncbi:hypothetical protein [Nocardia xishanensis]
MSAGDELLRRIEGDPELAGLLAWPGDFDITRREPVEDLRLPSGTPLTPIAGDRAGGTFFLCGAQGTERPVLYADSEGGAVLLAADLVEAVALIATYPYWRDLGTGRPVAELEEQFAVDRPEFLEVRAELLDRLGIAAPGVAEAVRKMRASAARTVPDFLPVAPDVEGDAVYVPLW